MATENISPYLSTVLYFLVLCDHLSIRGFLKIYEMVKGLIDRYLVGWPRNLDTSAVFSFISLFIALKG